MKTWDNLYPWVLPYVLGCPDPTVDRALCDAAREFCNATSAWSEWSDQFTAPGTTQRFDFDLPTGSELVRSRRANVAGEDWGALPSTNLPPQWEDETATKPEQKLIHISQTEYLLVPAPDAGDAVRIELILRPTITGTGIGNDVFAKYGEGLAAGAKSRLMLIPRQPWSDPVYAALCKGQFEEAKHTAANEGWQLRTPSERRTKIWGSNR